MGAEHAELWCRLRQRLDEEAVAAKGTMDAVFRLSRAYGELSQEERPEVNRVLCEWVASDDAGLRYDALFLVAKHRIQEAVPALRQLQDRLESSPTHPGDPYEWAKVNRILGDLGSGYGAS